MTNTNKPPTQSGSQQDSFTLLSVNALVLRLREQETLLRPRQQQHSQETRRAFLLSTLSQALELVEEMMGDDYD
jgi:hypothetical protein